MTVKITGAVPTAKMLEKIKDHITSTKPIEGIVKEGQEEIKAKTKKFRDYKNRRFEEYSEAYAKKKGVGRANVDLDLSGEMLRSMDGKVKSPHKGLIFIPNEGHPHARLRKDMLADIHNAGRIAGKKGRFMPKREFFNLNKTFIKKMKKKYFDDPILRIIRRMP